MEIRATEAVVSFFTTSANGGALATEDDQHKSSDSVTLCLRVPRDFVVCTQDALVISATASLVFHW
jgi:hypothetical protein